MTDSGLKLFITHLPNDWTDKILLDYFSTYGKVASVEVFKDRFGSICSSGFGCAYVKFLCKAEGEQAMAQINHSQAK